MNTNPMKPLIDKISITIDSDIHEKARELAEMDDRSLSQFINIALKEYVKKLENKNWFYLWDAFFSVLIFVENYSTNWGLSNRVQNAKRKVQNVGTALQL